MKEQESAQPTAECLGYYLDCSQDVIADALAAAPEDRPHARIGNTLVAAGIITEDELVGALTAQRVDRLSLCPIFENLDASEYERLSRCVYEVSFDPGALLIRQGAVQPVMYILASGRLEVYRTAEEDEEIHLAAIGPGEAVGEMAYFSNGVRSANVRTSDRAHLLALELSQLPTLFETIPRLAQSLFGLVTRRLQQTNLLYEENQYRARAAQRSLSQLNRFLELSGSDELGVGIEGLIERLVHTASTLMDADRASLFLIDPATGRTVVEGRRRRRSQRDPHTRRGRYRRLGREAW